MSHDGSEDPIDFTISNAIYDLIAGKSAEEIAEELGWELEDVNEIHPDNISEKVLSSLAEEHYWPDDHLDDLGAAIKKYLSEK